MCGGLGFDSEPMIGDEDEGDEEERRDEEEDTHAADDAWSWISVLSTPRGRISTTKRVVLVALLWKTLASFIP